MSIVMYIPGAGALINCTLFIKMYLPLLKLKRNSTKHKGKPVTNFWPDLPLQ